MMGVYLKCFCCPLPAVAVVLGFSVCEAHKVHVQRSADCPSPDDLDEAEALEEQGHQGSWS